MAHLAFLIILLAAALSGVYSTGFIERDALPEANIAPLGGSFQWTNCGQPSDAVTIESLAISPNPPIPGEGLKMTITFVAKEVIEEGAYADVTTKLGRIKLLQKIIDICEELQDNNSRVQCPVNEGRHEFEHTVMLPIEIPPASFTVNIRAYTVDDDDMMCLDLKLNFIGVA